MYKYLICIILILIVILYKSLYNSNNKDIEVYLYYTKWCGHSKNFLKNVWDNLTTKLNKLNIKYYLVDGDKNKQECIDRNIKGFPTLLIKSNNNYIEYTGKRDSDLILNFVNQI